jgi:two-component system cell cycle response regulator
MDAAPAGGQDPDVPGEARSRILIVAGAAEALDARRAAIADQAGYHVISAQWPASVPSLIEEHTPDLLVLCVAANEEWGFEECADLRLVDPAHEVPLLLLLADLEPDAIERGLRAGADDVVRASIGDGELRARIEVQLRNRRHRDALRTLRSERDNLKIKATLDPLTKVLNRGALEEALFAELGRGAPFAVMFVDLDHFKSINDKFGHDVGDAVLRELGAYLKRTIRSNDIAGRYGGEEFVVCLAGCDMNVAPKVAERHRELISRISFPKEKHPERVTASIGVAVFDPDNPDASLSALLKRADAAVYQAKHKGRNRVVVASPLRRSVEEQVSAKLAQAISRGSLPLVSKPSKSKIVAMLESKLVKQLNEGHAPLPVIPAVATAALKMAQAADVNITSLAALVEQDPLLAARFLAVANSALYYRGFRTASTRDAVMRMGLSEARNVLGSIANSIALPQYNDVLQRLSERATLSGKLALAASKELRLNYEPAYLCGLLHNLGEARVLRILAGMPRPDEGVEPVLALVEKYHTQAGAQLAEKWHLHSDIVQACALHHDERHIESRPVRVAMMSDALTELAYTPSAEREQHPATAKLRQLNITPVQVENVLRSVPISGA